MRVVARVAALLGTSGCIFTPDYDVADCRLHCEETCPTGFECRAGYCVSPAFSGTCGAATVSLPSLPASTNNAGSYEGDADSTSALSDSSTSNLGGGTQTSEFSSSDLVGGAQTSELSGSALDGGAQTGEGPSGSNLDGGTLTSDPSGSAPDSGAQSSQATVASSSNSECPCSAADASVTSDGSLTVEEPTDGATGGPTTTSGITFLDGRTLPAACAGQRYEYRFDASGGAGHYTWSDVAGASLPDWLTLSRDGELTGVVPLGAESSAVFTVQVGSGAMDNPVARQFTLPILARCKFAFLGDKSGRTRLFLGDARRARDPDRFAATDLSAELAETRDVQSFEFAPNGTALAFSVGDESADGASALYVVGTSVDGALPLTEILPSLPDRFVRGFVWSPDSSRLVILTNNPTAETFALYAATVGSGHSAEEVARAYPLSWSELFRVGDYVCYFTAQGERSCVPFDAPGGDASVFPVDSLSVLENPDFVQWTSTGRYQAVYDKGAELDPFVLMLMKMDGAQQARSLEVYGIPDDSMRLMAQPGDYTDRSVARLFPLGEGLTVGTAATPTATVPRCESLLALQPEAKAVACAHEGQLRLATLNDNLTISREQDVTNGDLTTTTALARTFNYGSTRYVYDTFEGVVVVNLEQDTWSAVPLLGHDAQQRAVFAPMAGGRTLLHVGTALHVLDAEGAERVSGDVPLPSPLWCEETFARGGPYEWCGSTRLSKSFAPSEETDSVLFVSQSAELFVVDTRRADTEETTDVASVASAPVLVSDAKLHCSAKRRKDGRPERLALGCEQELQWAP